MGGTNNPLQNIVKRVIFKTLSLFPGKGIRNSDKSSFDYNAWDVPEISHAQLCLALNESVNT